MGGDGYQGEMEMRSVLKKGRGTSRGRHFKLKPNRYVLAGIFLYDMKGSKKCYIHPEIRVNIC